MSATLSIVMPDFNRPKELRTMLDSILANTFQNWELWAVDDGSEQETLSMLELYASQDERIHFIRRERLPKGAQTCRNIGMEQAKGEYIVFFDSDDYIAPYCLEQRMRGILKCPDLDFMVFRSGVYGDGDIHWVPYEKCYGFSIYRDDVAAFCARTLPFVVCNNIYRTQQLRAKGLSWDETLLSLQDGDFNLQVLLAGLHYGYAQALPDYGYRIAGNNGSISKRITSTAHLNSHLYSVEKNYRTVQNKYGSKYNKALFLGALFFYNAAFSTETCYEEGLKLADIVTQFSPGYGRLFLAKIKVHHLLRHLCSNMLAKKIVLADFLLWQKWQKWCAKHKKRKYVELWQESHQ